MIVSLALGQGVLRRRVTEGPEKRKWLGDMVNRSESVRAGLSVNDSRTGNIGWHTIGTVGSRKVHGQMEGLEMDRDQVNKAPGASASLLALAIEVITRPTHSDEERDATVAFFEYWNPAQFLTTEDALKLRNVVMNAEEYAGWRRELVDSITSEVRGDIN